MIAGGGGGDRDFGGNRFPIAAPSVKGETEMRLVKRQNEALALDRHLNRGHEGVPRYGFETVLGASLAVSFACFLFATSG